jgi:monoamine oxidase
MARPTTVERTTTTTRKSKVVIVGAGAAGLQCAYALLQTQACRLDDLVILEARHRIGGRVHTWQTTATAPTTASSSNDTEEQMSHGAAAAPPGFPKEVDLGAAWVHGTENVPVANPMLQFLHPDHLQEIAPGNPWLRPGTVLHRGLRGESSSSDGTTEKAADTRLLHVYYQGERLDEDEVLVRKALAQHFDIFQQRVPQKARDLYQQGRGLETAAMNLQDTLDELEQDASPDPDDTRLHRLTRFYRHLVSAWYGKPASQLQLAAFSNDETGLENGDTSPPDWFYQEEGDFRGPHCLVKGGMHEVLKPMIEKVGKTIRLGRVVTEIWQEDDSLFVQTEDGSTYETSACVVTLPVNCLHRDMPSLFQKTPLSAEKKEAVGYMSMGSYKKVMLSFDRIFWPVDPPFLAMLRECGADTVPNGTVGVPPGIGDSLLIDNVWAKDGVACLEAILVGNSANWATGRSDEEIRRAVLDFVGESMDLSAEDLLSWCVGCHVTRWEEDPYSRGAYASLALGALPRHVTALMDTEWGGALAFAGDAVVEDFEGSVHAALFSGSAAADKVHRYLSGDMGANAVDLG